MLSHIYDIDFPSSTLREQIYRGFGAKLAIERSALDTISWMEGRFARALCEENTGPGITMMEVELKEIYVSSGLVETLATMTGNTLSADTLLGEIRRQIMRLMSDA